MDSNKKIKPYYKIKENIDIDNEKVNYKSSISSRSWFYGNEISNIYKIPTPTNNNYVVSVVSFGGGLFGTVSNSGILTNGDVQKYWTSIGISSNNFPTVVVKTIGGTVNNPNGDLNSTIENTIDVESIGMCCPSSKLTIVLYIAPNSFSSFISIISAILNDQQYVPNAISISWGAPEVYYDNNTLNQINSALLNAVNRNINVIVATGDNGSNDGVGGSGNYCDFPSSSPNVVACGGTYLNCPNYIYDSNTKEIAWSSGGGGISSIFAKPVYQNGISGTKRSTPDVSLVADPNSGVLYLINNTQYVIGGTSISTPIFAGFLAASNTKNFINPIIYNSGVLSFHDITNGANGKYSAKVGYDNCTGFGSIKGDILNQIINYTVSLNATVVSIKINNTYTLVPTSNYNYNSYYLWTSSNVKVAKVSATGVITGVGTGTTTIRLNTINPNVSKVVTVSVTSTLREKKGLFLRYLASKNNK